MMLANIKCICASQPTAGRLAIFLKCTVSSTHRTALDILNVKHETATVSRTPAENQPACALPFPSFSPEKRKAQMQQALMSF